MNSASYETDRFRIPMRHGLAGAMEEIESTRAQVMNLLERYSSGERTVPEIVMLANRWRADLNELSSWVNRAIGGYEDARRLTDVVAASVVLIREEVDRVASAMGTTSTTN